MALSRSLKISLIVLFSFATFFLIWSFRSSSTPAPAKKITLLDTLAQKIKTFDPKAQNQDLRDLLSEALENHGPYETLQVLMNYCEAYEGGAKMYHQHIPHRLGIAAQPHIRNVCETGFSVGHSALMWLIANPQLHLYEFDIWENVGAQEHCKKFVDALFPGRMTLIKGDSADTIAEAVAARSNPKSSTSTVKYPDYCDIVAVDTALWKMRRADLFAFAPLARPNSNYVFHRVTLPYQRRGVEVSHRAEYWTEAINVGILKELFCVVSSSPIEDHFSNDCIGTYVKH